LFSPKPNSFFEISSFWRINTVEHLIWWLRSASLDLGSTRKFADEDVSLKMSSGVRPSVGNDNIKPRKKAIKIPRTERQFLLVNIARIPETKQQNWRTRE
jgi:hypothetical protein